MEKVELTKSEFIRRSMNGEVFELNGQKYFYAESDEEPFRLDLDGLNGLWRSLDGINEFTVVEPEVEMITVYEWVVTKNKVDYYITNILYSEEEAYLEWDNPIKTGRSFEVPK